MFTGIITDIGTVRAITRDTGGEWGDTRMEVTCAYDTSSIDIGASISHAGACMTVIEKGPNWYAFEVSDESLDKTTMSAWKVGQKINLERALTGADELGGHLVTGHVDGVGTLTAREEIAGSIKLDFTAPAHIAFGIAPKGSITIEGVSLTVNTAKGSTFSVNIIPHTATATTLGGLQVGDEVNLEIDLIARYVARYLGHMKDPSA
ncbi:riboflavin synthase subunit alpha [Litorimonas cladophorae]|uniref:Riboflavin synthase n=1 Tax=Litorimonas cladophorae TaxID=1220491 RepID=A0A918NDN8_9PROT|nr:riboflavin synthase [Litorimonas cladophorae]GGX59613.1 riboflavin synthase subunit alpha [Litorimonas cladophorae]